MKIGSLLSQVYKSGLVDAQNNSIVVTHMSDRAMKIIYFSNNSGSRLLKIYSNKKGYYEYETLSFLADYLKEYTVKPDGFFQDEQNTLSVVPYVAQRELNVADMASPSIAKQVVDVLICLHRVKDAREIKLFCEQINFAELMPCVEKSLGLSVDYKDYFNSAVPVVLQRLLEVPQHGDFTFTNLGVRDNGMLFVFDWEDYGRIRWPGFDFATFLASFLHHSNTYNSAVGSVDSFIRMTERKFGSGVYKGLDLDSRTFAFLFPFYLTGFMFLKKRLNYADTIIDRITGMIEYLFKSADWQRFIRKGLN
ncbi:MAG: hypothetical protein GY853_08585 [PVC group bacterium]|nr:hypothetical protein [PVC group bacterium]